MNNYWSAADAAKLHEVMEMTAYVVPYEKPMILGMPVVDCVCWLCVGAVVCIAAWEKGGEK